MHRPFDINSKQEIIKNPPKRVLYYIFSRIYIRAGDTGMIQSREQLYRTTEKLQ
jgi:hypothetical protein